MCVRAVGVHMCICVCVFVCVYMCVYVCICVYMCVCVYVYVLLSNIEFDLHIKCCSGSKAPLKAIDVFMLAQVGDSLLTALLRICFVVS